jgi:hypothetical protein
MFFFIIAVIILAVKYSLAREIVYFAAQLGMTTGDYVFIVFELSVDQLRIKLKDSTKWFNSLHKATANFTQSLKEAFESVLILTVNLPGSKEYEDFNYDLKIKAPQPPFFSDVYQGYKNYGWGKVYNFDIPVSCHAYV